MAFGQYRPQILNFATVFFCYLLASLFITFPLILNLNQALPHWPTLGKFPGDSQFFLWFLWWFKKAIFNLHQNPLFTDYIFAPNQVYLGTGLEYIINIIFSLPLQVIFSPVVAYNLLVIFNFALSGLAVFCFVDYFVKSRLASFVSGIYFLTSSYMILRSLGHFNLQITGWLVFYFLFLVKMFEEGRTRDGVVAAVFLLLATLSSWYYLIFSFVISLIIFVWYYKYSHIPISFGLKSFLVSSLVLIGPLIAFLGLLNPSSNKILPLWSLGWSFLNSADLLSYFIPQPFSFLFGHKVLSLQSRLNPASTGPSIEKVAFIGFFGLFSSIYFFLKGKTKRKTLWFWVLAGSFLLSLGPLLTIGGRYIFRLPGLGWEFSLPLPLSLLFYFFPPLRFTRAPNRFSVYALLVVALCLGYTVKNLVLRHHRLIFRTVGLVLVIVYLLLENLIWPYPTLELRDNKFYSQIKKDKNDYLILNIPVREEKLLSHPYLADQIIHEKRIVNGAVQYTVFSPKLLEFSRKEPVISWFNCDTPGEIPAGLTISSFEEIAHKVFIKHNIRYTVVHKDFFFSPECQDVKNLYQILFEAKFKVYEDEKISVYKFI